MAILSACLLVAGVLRHYWDIYVHRTVRGISFLFVAIDAAGDLFSLVSICTFFLSIAPPPSQPKPRRGEPKIGSIIGRIILRFWYPLVKLIQSSISTHLWYPRHGYLRKRAGLLAGNICVWWHPELPSLDKEESQGMGASFARRTRAWRWTYDTTTTTYLSSGDAVVYLCIPDSVRDSGHAEEERACCARALGGK